MVSLDQLSQFWLLCGTVIEVSTQRQDNEEWAVRLRDGRHQHINETLPLLFSRRLCEQFLELVNEEDDSRFRSPSQVACEQVQTACRVVFQNFVYPCQAPIVQVLRKCKCEGLHGMPPWVDGIQVDPLRDPRQPTRLQTRKQPCHPQ